MSWSDKEIEKTKRIVVEDPNDEDVLHYKKRLDAHKASEQRRLEAIIERTHEKAHRKNTVFVSGYMDLTLAEFEEHYVPKLREAVKKGMTFVVGDAPGCDYEAQRYLCALDASYTVYHMLDKPRGLYDPCVRTIGGFPNDALRDGAMTQVSSSDIAWVRPEKKTKKSSGTAKNLERREKRDLQDRLDVRATWPRYRVDHDELYPHRRLCTADPLPPPTAKNSRNAPPPENNRSLGTPPDARPGHRDSYTYGIPVPPDLEERARKAFAEYEACQNELKMYEQDHEELKD